MKAKLQMSVIERAVMDMLGDPGPAERRQTFRPYLSEIIDRKFLHLDIEPGIERLRPCARQEIPADAIDGARRRKTRAAEIERDTREIDPPGGRIVSRGECAARDRQGAPDERRVAQDAAAELQIAGRAADGELRRIEPRAHFAGHRQVDGGERGQSRRSARPGRRPKAVEAQRDGKATRVTAVIERAEERQPGAVVQPECDAKRVDLLGARHVEGGVVDAEVGDPQLRADAHAGGGEVARYVARHGEPQGRVAKAVLVSAVPPLMLKTDKNPGGLPLEVFDSFRKALAGNRAQFFLDVPTGPFYGFNRPGAKVDEGVIWNWWRQGMMGGAKAHYDGIKAFSETDQTADLEAIGVPTLVLHGEDDQIVPIDAAARESIKHLRNGTLKTYPGYGHGMLTVNAETLNADLLAFVQG